LDQYPSYQGLFDDTKRSLFVFDRSFSAIGDNAFDNGEKHHKSQREVGEVFHHIPEFPERSIQMENRCIDEGIIQCESCYDQKRPEEEIDNLQYHIEYLPKSHAINRCASGGCSINSLY